MGNDLMDQQVSCLWVGNHLLSVSLSGFINYLDVNNPSKPLRVIKGHNKSITALAVHSDPGSNHKTIYTGSHDGFITHWDSETGESDRCSGSPHTNQVADMTIDSNNLYSCGLDDTIRVTSLKSNEVTNDVKMDSQPRGIALVRDQSLLVVAGFEDVSLLKTSGDKVFKLSVKFEPNCVDAHPSNGHVAVGGDKDSKVHVYQLDSSSLSEIKHMDHRDSVTDVKYSPDGNYLAACDANRKIILYLPGNDYGVSLCLVFLFLC